MNTALAAQPEHAPIALVVAVTVLVLAGGGDRFRIAIVALGALIIPLAIVDASKLLLIVALIIVICRGRNRGAAIDALVVYTNGGGADLMILGRHLYAAIIAHRILTGQAVTGVNALIAPQPIPADITVIVTVLVGMVRSGGNSRIAVLANVLHTGKAIAFVGYGGLTHFTAEAAGLVAIGQIIRMLHLGGAHLSAEGAEGGAGVGVIMGAILRKGGQGGRRKQHTEGKQNGKQSLGLFHNGFSFPIIQSMVIYAPSDPTAPVRWSDPRILGILSVYAGLAPDSPDAASWSVFRPVFLSAPDRC